MALEPTLLNFVSCEFVSRDYPFILRHPRRLWPEPPRKIVFWVEIANLAEREFTVQIQLWRGRRLEEQSETELILPGVPDYQGRFEFAFRHELDAKTHHAVVLLNGVIRRKLNMDFGAKGQ